MTGPLVDLLNALGQSPAPPSELASALRCSIHDIHLQVEALKNLGFDIPLHPLLGYSLNGPAEPLRWNEIQRDLAEPWICSGVVLQTTDSTNTLAMEHGMRGERGPYVFFAEHQTAGRGRFGRIWESQMGDGLWMSLLLSPKGPPQEWPRLTTAAALAVAHSLNGIAGLTALIKWPNDIVVSERKVCGILAESAHTVQGEPFVILGIGVNVNQESFHGQISTTAGSLRTLTGKTWNRNQLAARILEELGRTLKAAHSNFETLVSEARNLSVVLGKKLTLHTGGETHSGLAEDLDEEGRIVLKLPDGSRRSFAAGEVSLRPLT